MPRSTYADKVDYIWVPAIADTTKPTTTEMTAGTQLTCAIETFPELAESTSSVDAPQLCSAFTAKYPDTVSVDDVTIVFYYNDTPSSSEQTIMALLERGTTGFLCRVDSVAGTLPDYKTAATKVDVWPAAISSNFKNQAAVGDMKKFTVGLTITGEPSIDAVVTAP